MRAPFDFQAAIAALTPKEPSKLQKIAAIVAPTLMALAGNQAGANALMSRIGGERDERDRRRWEAARLTQMWQHEDWGRQNEADLRAAEPFTNGRNRLDYNPATGEVTTLYAGPADYQSYASNLDLTAGTPAYNAAMQDYVLRANGPTALANDETLDDYRTGNRLRVEDTRQANRIGLEGQRQRNRIGLEGVRQDNRMTTRATPTYRETHPSPRRGSGGALPVVKTPEEAMRLPPGTHFRTPDGRVKVRP
jgi:hypothetical protein